MTARNFSEDGAVGAMTGGSPADGSQVGGVTSGTLLPSSSVTGTTGGGSSASELTSPLNDSVGGVGGGWGGGGLAGGTDSGSTGTQSASSSSAGGLAAPTSGKSTSYSGDWRDQINQNKNWATPWAGMTQDTGGFQTGGVSWGFADGGAIDENADPNATDPQGSAMGASLQNSINQALTTVTGVLSYGRKLHGLGGGEQQQASGSVLPSKPFSESQKERPMPGPLAPTSNPFGKRADAGNTSSDQSGGANDQGSAQAIDTEEEAA